MASPLLNTWPSEGGHAHEVLGAAVEVHKAQRCPIKQTGTDGATAVNFEAAALHSGRLKAEDSTVVKPVIHLLTVLHENVRCYRLVINGIIGQR